MNRYPPPIPLIKEPNPNSKNASMSDFPHNLLKDESFLNKTALILCKLPRDSDQIILEKGRRYEIFGKFYYGKFGMVLEGLYFNDITTLFTEPFLMVMNLLEREGLLHKKKKVEEI